MCLVKKKIASEISRIKAREILDSRGIPTIEVELSLKDPKNDHHFLTTRAIVPSGSSTGEREAFELRDQNVSRHLGKGVLSVIKNIEGPIAKQLIGKKWDNQEALDLALIQLDGTPNKSHLGANALLGISMAHVRALALSQRISTSDWIAAEMNLPGVMLPVPQMNILNGGKHANNGLNIQECMIIPAGFESFSEALRAGCEIFQYLKKELQSKNLSTSVGDEGGFAPHFQGEHPHEQALKTITQAIKKAGYRPGEDIFIALDAAASEFYDPQSGYCFEGKKYSSKEMIALYTQWSKAFPIISIEDGLDQNDWLGWELLTQTLGQKCQLVGDDLFVTQTASLKKGIEKKIANAILIKLNQVGTVTETLQTMKLAFQSHYSAIVSHRSGETEDTFIADLAVGTECGQIKTGSASRTDRIAKYNELLRIAETKGIHARFPGLSIFKGFLKK